MTDITDVATSNSLADLAHRIRQEHRAVAIALKDSVRHAITRFVKEIEELDDPEEIIKAALAANVGVIVGPGYNSLAGRSEQEGREWHTFMLFLVQTYGWHPVGATSHVEWLLQRPFQNVAEWLGPEGEKFRRTWGMPTIPDATKESWQAFVIQHTARSLPDLVAELNELERQAGPARPAGPSRKRRSKQAAAE